MSEIKENTCECGFSWWMRGGSPRSGFAICPQCGVANRAKVRYIGEADGIAADLARLAGAERRRLILCDWPMAEEGAWHAAPTETELREAVEWVTSRAPNWDARNRAAVQRLGAGITELTARRAADDGVGAAVAEIDRVLVWIADADAELDAAQRAEGRTPDTLYPLVIRRNAAHEAYHQANQALALALAERRTAPPVAAGAGPTDRELEAAVAWVWAQGPLDPLSAVSNHQCALAALLEWYLRHRDAAEIGATSAERWHLYQVAVRARDLTESLTDRQVFKASGDWRAAGKDETLDKLIAAIGRWAKWEAERAAGAGAGG